MKNPLLILAFFILALCLADRVEAQDEPRLMFGGWSYHLDRDTLYNERHRLTGIGWGPVSVMRFVNSLDREAYGAGIHHLPYRWHGLELGGYAGAWTGYTWAVTPVAGVAARYRWGPLSGVITSAGVVTVFHLEISL